MNRRLFRVIRRLNGHYQRDAARHFGVSQSAVSKWETGETGIDRRHLRAMHEYALMAAKSLLEPLGIEICRPSPYNRPSSELTPLDSIDSDE